jgi:hypothetical protein
VCTGNQGGARKGSMDIFVVLTRVKRTKPLKLKRYLFISWVSWVVVGSMVVLVKLTFLAHSNGPGRGKTWPIPPVMSNVRSHL